MWIRYFSRMGRGKMRTKTTILEEKHLIEITDEEFEKYMEEAYCDKNWRKYLRDNK